MLKLKACLALELPRINAALRDAADRLPAPVRPLALHVFNAGGKRLRPFLTVLVARMLGYAGKDIYPLSVTLEMLHAATLIHDDVLDNAGTRRGAPAVHTVYGSTMSILAGDAMLSTANGLVAEHGDLRLVTAFSDAISRTAAGEILEIAAMRNLAQDAGAYHEIILGKTAWLIRSACLMGALKAGATEERIAAAAAYGENLGLAFQMVDDALDVAPAEIIGKPSGGDIREGKLTPPVRMYRESLSGQELAAFDAAFTAGTFTDEDAARIGARIRALGFDIKTREMAGACLDTARAALHILPDGTEKRHLLRMTDYVQQREK
ncbi:MAG: polyprenyl synthetase family protein [Desulfovibrionaceae bacterium]|nr:polyprenyl synthetase family protein [Desulfovibrionaceae bacterium]